MNAGRGYTFASGTGACAAAAASHRLGLVEDAVTVHMHGGDLLSNLKGWKNFHDRTGRIYRKDYCGRTVFCLTENESGEKRGNKLQ